MSTVKVMRNLNSGDVSQLADDQSAKKRVSLVVVHAADQPWDEPPTKAALEMVSMIRDLKDDTSAILPAGLHTVETTPHYAFTVACKSMSDDGQILIPCQKILVLVRSTKKSTTTKLGGGYKLITPDVEDLLGTDNPHQVTGETKHTLSAMCTMENLTDYRLDPPRGGTQHALVIVTAKTDVSFVIEPVQLLTSEEAAKAKQSLLKLLHVARYIHSRDRKRTVEWNDDFSPIMARKCRKVGRYPTDAPLPDC